MSTVSVVEALPPWTLTAATVLGGDAPTRGYAVELLSDAGFHLWSEPGPGTLVVLLGHPGEAARLRQIRQLAEVYPDAHILAVVPADAPNASLRRALLAGAAGIVLASDVDRALVAAARALLAGQLVVPRALGRQIAPRPLSHREKQILALVVLGLTNRQIADKVYLAESTVKTHVSSAFRKLDVRSRAEAVARIQDPEAGYGAGILALADPAIVEQRAV
jgi:DNA-binding NarL/FixJ family response regulator